MPNIQQARLVYDAIPKQIPLGADNDMSNPWRAAAAKRVNLIKPFLTAVRMIFLMNTTEGSMYRVDPKLQQVVDFGKEYQLDELCASVASSLIARSFEAGRCGEQANIALVEFLKSEFTGRLEKIKVKSSKSSDTHDMLVLNRDTRSDINEPSEWKAIEGNDLIIFDSWSRTLSTQKTSGVTKEDLARFGKLPGQAADISIDIILAIDNSLTAEQYQKINKFLKALRSFVAYAGIGLLRAAATKTGWSDINSAAECSRLLEDIDQEILCFQILQKADKAMPETKEHTQFSGFSGGFLNNLPKSVPHEAKKSEAEMAFEEVQSVLGETFMKRNGEKLVRIGDGSGIARITGILSPSAFEIIKGRLKDFELSYDQHPKGVNNFCIKKMLDNKLRATR